MSEVITAIAIAMIVLILMGAAMLIVWIAISPTNASDEARSAEHQRSRRFFDRW